MSTFTEKRMAYDFTKTVLDPLFNGFVNAIGRAMDATELGHCKEYVSRLDKEIEELEREMISLKWYNWIRKIEIRDALDCRIKNRDETRDRIAELEEKLGGE